VPLPGLPTAARNPLSLVGVAIATTMATLFLVLLLLELLGYLTNPYLGLVVFVTVPAIFLVGLLLIPIGAWWARRRASGGAPPEWPVIDLRQPRQQSIAVAVLVLTVVNLVIVTMAAYGGVHYMESASFCGQVCHTTMEPQYVAHQAWPHARVACTECHIGPGASAFVEAKMAGTRQLLQVMTNRVPRPVPPPDRLIQPAVATCGGCHSPDTLRGDTIRVLREYADDESSSEAAVTTLRMRLGSPAVGGIHRHLALEIEYMPGESGTIPYVRTTYPDGMVREFRSADAPSDVPAAARRRMECIDCHNRPAHTFDVSPQRAVDAEIARGRLPRDLPFARREAVAAVSDTYPDRETALAAIAERLNRFYATQPGASPTLVPRLVASAQAAWSRNVFPAMNVTWGTYPNQIGHLDAPGCFRCHDEGHTAADGAVISQDCELCHSIE
jgi:nitrate/TMAO reductase-like tetraheme cytochrome c subunit